MKKLLLIGLIVICFGCSKKSDSNAKPTTWITGKWKATVRYQMNQVTKKTDTLAIDIELTFTSDGYIQTGGTDYSQYTLGPVVNTINNYNGGGTIKQESSTQFLLYSQITTPDGLTIYNVTDVFNKE